MIEALIHEWGNPPSYVQVIEQDECEIISFYNNFSTYPFETFSFFINEHQIFITIGSNTTPDTMFVIPRAGTYLNQETITIPEHTEGSVTACPLAMF